ncbi:hypothetical protein GGF46_002453 [Coemansia sp. RSA 552]|nr:hypothetical protein GGF46_002453 [Coemansia sp. RSA 552]
MRILGSFLLLAACASAESQHPFAAPNHSPDSCPADTVSCQRTDVDPCCSPANGLLVLAQQWDTRWGPSDAFTVHGLWPDTCAGKQLPRNGCDPSRAFANVSAIIDASSDSGLREDMDTFWPSNKGDNNWFWSHEWSKHGTCVTTLHPSCYASEYSHTQEVAEYFRSILDLRAKYDIHKALNASGIVPTEPEPGRRPKNTYSREAVISAIRDAWGVEPNIKCRGRRLQEVWLWFKVKGRDNYYPVEPWGWDSCGPRISYQQKST